MAEARASVARVAPLELEEVALQAGLARRVGRDILALADCPSLRSSLKDGFAVRSADVATASPGTPVSLQVIDRVAAGGQSRTAVKPGQAIRIMTGAPVPEGADAVLAAEFARDSDDQVQALADAHPGRNILEQGSDVACGEVLIRAGTLLTPARLGLLAAGGVASVPVHRRPRVMVVATGSELVAPDEPILPGKVAASNMVTLVAELTRMGLAPDWLLIRDDLESLQEQMRPLIGCYDCVLTCGGVLDGDKDFTMQAMQELDIQPVFHRVRIGPGKGVCFGQSRDGETLFFNLPGGPPSNHVAFLLLARPCIERLAGMKDPFATARAARLAEDIRGQQDWTQFFYGQLIDRDAEQWVRPITDMSRLAAMAAADCLIELPEGEQFAGQGSTVETIWTIR